MALVIGILGKTNVTIPVGGLMLGGRPVCMTSPVYYP